MWLALALSVPVQFCLAADAAMEVAPAADVSARTSLDELDGPAPRNLVVYRDGRAGYVEATLDNLDDAAPPVAVTQGSATMLQRFEVGAVPEGDRGAFTLHDPLYDAADPSRPERTIAFFSSSEEDAEAPIIDEVLHAIEDKIAGGLSFDCGPLPSWRQDEWVTTVGIPAATDDVGIAAWELWVTLDGVDSIADVEVEGAGDRELVARTFAAKPERVWVVALDHAGNASEPALLGHVHGESCSQIGGASFIWVLSLLFVTRRGRRFTLRAVC